ncbi:MAG: sodium:solute symporter, partial [Candidatus Brocadiia bacterium]|nr:sodium:solute symporter [Candidatus Brocadiia bacterium]
SLWDTYIKILGLLMGSLTGLFALGIFTRKAKGNGALVGAILSAVILYLVWKHTDVHMFLYATVGITACFIIGYLASLIGVGKAKSIEGLTIYTLGPKQDVAPGEGT